MPERKTCSVFALVCRLQISERCERSCVECSPLYKLQFAGFFEKLKHNGYLHAGTENFCWQRVGAELRNFDGFLQFSKRHRQTIFAHIRVFSESASHGSPGCSFHACTFSCNLRSLGWRVDRRNTHGT